MCRRTATAPQASAVAWNYTMHTNDGDPGGLIQFAANGDYVQVCDVEADGYAVRGVVVDYTGNHSYTLTAGSNGACSVTSAATSGRDLAENTCVTFRVALYKNGGDNQYEDVSSWYNGSPTHDCV